MIKIHKSTAKKTEGKFYVTIQGKNGEVLNTSETLNTKASAKKNIKAVADLFQKDFKRGVEVHDCTGKIEKVIVI